MTTAPPSARHLTATANIGNDGNDGNSASKGAGKSGKPFPIAASAARSHSSTLCMIQGRLALQQRCAGPDVQNTVLDLIALCDEPDLCRQSGLLGIVSSNRHGQTNITLHTDDLLRISLHQNELCYLEDFICSGTASARDKLAILDEIRSHLAQRKASENGRRLRDAINACGINIEVAGEARRFMRLMREIKAVFRLEDILEKYRLAEESIAHDLLSRALAGFAQHPEIFHDDQFFSGLLVKIKADLFQTGSRNARLKVRAICADTIAAYGLLPGSPAYLKLQAAIAHLDENAMPFGADNLQSLVREVCADLHQASRRNMPAWSPPAQDKLFMPTRAMKTWISALEQTRSAAASPQQAADCHMLLEQAKDRWLRHALRFDDMRSFFTSMQQVTASRGQNALSTLAGQLRQKTPGPEYDDFDLDKDELSLKTQLHDNADYRVFESALSAFLIEHPSAGMQSAMTKLGAALADYIVPSIRPLNADDYFQIAEIRRSSRSQQHAWLRQIPLYEKFLETESQAESAYLLHQFLTMQKTTGIECIAIPYLATLAVNSAPSTKNPAWNRRALESYGAIVDWRRIRVNNREAIPQFLIDTADLMLAQGEIDENGHKVLRQQSAAILARAKRRAPRSTGWGIAMLHQRPNPTRPAWMLPIMRPALDFKPEFLMPGDGNATFSKKLPKHVQTALATGNPYVADLSGVAHRLMYMVDAFNQDGHEIAARDVLITTSVLLTALGTHCFQESFSMVNRIDVAGTLDLGLELGDGAAPDEFVTDLTWLFRSADGAHFSRACEAAFKAMLEPV